MTFLNIGPGELFFVLVMALLVFGPQRLPEIARKLGQGVRDLRNMVNNLDPELLQDWRDLTSDLDTVRDEMRSIRSDLVEMQKDLATAAKEVSTSVEEAAKDAASAVDDAIQQTATATSKASTPAVKPTPKPATAGATATQATTTATATSTATQSATASASSTATQAATAGSVAASAPKPATGPAKPTVAPRPAPAASAIRAAQATAAAGGSAVPETADEIVGTLLVRDEDGVWRSLNEIVGVKVFPVWRPAPRPARNGNGHHQLDLVKASREARMIHLASAAPAGARVRQPVGAARLNPRPRPVVAARLERVKRG
jgi:Tat protein translocase TatB subunit